MLPRSYLCGCWKVVSHHRRIIYSAESVTACPGSEEGAHGEHDATLRTFICSNTCFCLLEIEQLGDDRTWNGDGRDLLWNFISDRRCLSTNSGQEVAPYSIAAKLKWTIGHQGIRSSMRLEKQTRGLLL